LSDWEDYYQILGVAPEATEEETKRAYLDKVHIFHPDRLMGAPESARHVAEEELKRVNRAYGILKDPIKRREYLSKWVKRKVESEDQPVPAPKPVVYPHNIRLKDIEPGEPQTAYFIIRNNGGPYTKIWFSNPESWLKVTGYSSLTVADELPLQVELEAQGQEWNTSYFETIAVRLDNQETQVRVELHTKRVPEVRVLPISPSAVELLRLHLIVGLLLLPLIAPVGLMLALFNYPGLLVWGSPISYRQCQVESRKDGETQRR
jgi:hypothetical protein